MLALATGIVVVAGFGLSILAEALAQLGGSLGDVVYAGVVAMLVGAELCADWSATPARR